MYAAPRKMSHILCALLACAPLIFEARATASSEDGRSSVAAANVDESAGRAAPGRKAGKKPGRTGDRGSNQAGARTSDGSKGRDAAVAASPRGSSATPQAGAGKAVMGQADRGNADRLRSMLNARASGHLARQRSRPVGSTPGATGGPDLHGPQGASQAGQPKLAASTNSAASPAARPAVTPSSAASPAARPATTPRNSAIGGPHAQALARVGGPALSRTTHSGTIDGTQLHHK
jgi:hypothetical protein